MLLLIRKINAFITFKLHLGRTSMLHLGLLFKPEIVLVLYLIQKLLITIYI